MLTLKIIQDNPDFIIERLKIKGYDAREIVQKIIETNNKRRESQAKVDLLKAEMNRISKEIGILFREGKTNEANSAREQTAALKNEIKELDINPLLGNEKEILVVDARVRIEK